LPQRRFGELAILCAGSTTGGQAMIHATLGLLVFGAAYGFVVSLALF
jgi:hypothetical protein